MHPESSPWVSTIVEFKVSGYAKQHNDLIGSAGSLINFSVNIFSFPLFPILCPFPGILVCSFVWFCCHFSKLRVLRLCPQRLISFQRCITSPLFWPVPDPSFLCRVRHTANCVLISLAQSRIEPIFTMF